MNAETQFWLLFTNQWVDKKYHLTELLGNGGFGGVYKADEVVGDKLIRKVAVKLIKYDPNLLNSNEELFTVNLKHQNLIDCIVPGECLITIAGKEFHFYYLIMELADGSLKGMVTDVKELTNIVRCIAAGLSYLHGQVEPIIHRDIKPANILRVGNIWKISDFGLSKKLDPNLSYGIGRLEGTYYYMPPEGFGESDKKLGESHFSKAWDIWSLGVMIVELYTGDLPFLIDNLPQDLIQAFLEYGRRIHDMEPVIKKPLPKPFDQIVNGCLQKARKERLTAQQILEILNPPPPPPPPPPPTLPKFRFEVVTVNREGKIINKEWKEAEYFEEKLGNGVILEMVKIPAGEFMMGSKEGEGSGDEYPQHKVRIAKPFYMGKYPITQTQYEVIMGENPSYFKGEKRPVERVSWEEAKEFCKRLSVKTEKIYSLPSEAKWEYAGRAGTTTPFYYGKTLRPDLANYDGNYFYPNLGILDKLQNYWAELVIVMEEKQKKLYRQETTGVGIFPPNSFGLYDIHGNVWEWCEDAWHGNYKGVPNDGSAWFVEDKNYIGERLLRGGSWGSNPFGCRIAYRDHGNRTDFNFNIGFRVSCEIV